MLPRGWVYGAQYGLGNKGLGKLGLGERVVGWEEVSVKHLWGTHLLFSGEGGGERTTQRASRQPKSGRQTNTRKDR